MRLTVTQEHVGLHPASRVVRIDTVDGPERLTVWPRPGEAVADIEIGYPVGARDDALLVELPDETHTGAWRVWVPRELVME